MVMKTSKIELLEDILITICHQNNMLQYNISVLTFQYIQLHYIQRKISRYILRSLILEIKNIF